MPHLFERRDWLGNSPAVWILTAMVFCLPPAIWSVQQIRLENDIEQWLPPDDPELQVLRWAERQFPSEERIIVTWDGSSLGDSRIDLLRKRLEPVRDEAGIPRGGLPYIADVIDPREALVEMQRHDVPAHEAVRRLEGVLLGAGPLRVRLTDAGRSRLRRLRTELAESARAALHIELKVDEPASDLASLAVIPGYTTSAGDAVPPSAPAVLNAAGDIVSQADLEHDLAVSWRGIGVGTPQTQRVVDWLMNYRGDHDPSPTPLVASCFFVPGAPVALAIALSEAGQADRKEAIRLIRKAALESGIPKKALKLGGSPVASTELNREVAHAAWNTAFPITQIHRRSVILTSALVGATLALLLVRHVRLAVTVLLAALYSTFLAVALVPLTGGSLNLVLVVMPTLLLVITLSSGIHVVNYWQHAAAVEPRTAAIAASRAAWTPCFLAALTTSMGLASLCTSALVPVRDFGLYAALGTMLSFAVAVYGVPALLLFWRGPTPTVADVDHPGWRWLGQQLVKWPGVQALLVLALCAVASAGLTHFRTETKVIRYFGENSPIVQDYWFLESQLAGIVPVETIVRFDEAAQDQINFLDRLELVRAVQENLRKHPEVTGCLALPDFQPNTQPPDETASVVTRSKYHKRAGILQDRIRSGEIRGTEAFYSVVHSATPGLNEVGDELWRITAQVNVMSHADYGQILRDVNELAQEVLRFQPGARHVVTGTVPLFLRTQQAVLDSLLSSSLMAFGLIVLVLVVQLRSLWAALVAMIPNVLPITVVFGLVSLGGLRIDMGSMMTASIALGMAMDGTLHFLSWFRHRVAAGDSREQAVINALVHCGPAVWQTSWTVGLGLLVLVPAELSLISRFGWLMASMVGAALLGDIILLPQLLASPLGALFTAGIEPPAAAPPVATAQSRAAA